MLRHARLLTLAFSALGLSLLSGAASSQELSASAIVDRCVEALGGKESWDAIRTMELTGSFNTFSAAHPFVLRRQRPNLYWFDHTNFDQPVVIGFDGETAWWDSKMLLWSKAPWPVEMPVVYHAPIEAEAEFGGPLLDYQGKGHRVESLGKTELDGETLFGLEVSLKNGSIERWYLDPETYLPIARLSTDAAALDVKKRRTFFSDYREVAGVQIAHRVEIELGHFFQEMEIEQVEVNLELDERLFAMPLPGGMEELKHLPGTWDVKALSLEMPSLPWSETELTVTISSHAHGSLLSEELVYVKSGQPRHVWRQRTWDRLAGVFRTTLFDDFTSQLNVLEGQLEDGRLAVSNVASGTTWSLMGRTIHTREVTYDVERDSFKVDLETSFDGGQTWLPSERFIYSRAGSD